MKTALKMFALLLLLGACKQEVIEKEIEITPDYDKAVAVLHPVGDSGVHGVVHFEKAAGGVQVTAELEGLSEGKHGFHIHQWGDCTAPDGTSAGGHFNPMEEPHSSPEAEMRHMGDMGNITADANGNATITYMDNTINVTMILGRGVIVHGGEDDLTSQPSGAAGPRVSCGVIGVTK